MGLERHEGENFSFWVNLSCDPVIVQIMIDFEEEKINLTLMSW